LLAIPSYFATQSYQYQSTLRANASHYGQSKFALTGRGFSTLISGYDASSEGIFIHTTNEGVAYAGKTVWTLQGILKPNDYDAGDGFGMTFVADAHTILVSSPYKDSGRGAVYVFNGTYQHWTQIQKIQVDRLCKNLNAQLSKQYFIASLIISASCKASLFHMNVTKQLPPIYWHM
jgi:hypothetical protein